MKILLATYTTPESFLENLGVDEDNATVVAVKTKARYEDGDKIILEIGFPGLPNQILLRSIAFTPAREQGDYQWFRLEPGEEPQRDFLIAVASGRANARWTRRHRRFPMRMPARFVVEGEAESVHHEAETEDMAAGGISLKINESLPDGSRVTVLLQPGDGSTEIEFVGKVVWNREDDGNVEIGVQFDKPGGDSMKRLRQIIRGVRISGKTLE
ncbi:MAG: PilZ domain-containing protein [Proteobacteria bacterium]|nr:PilZ domain-containing protein [Pseudomonadota bacterium]